MANITLDPKATKLNKSKAYDLIMALKLGVDLSPVDIDSLLLHFCPAPPTKAKTAEQWVAKAAGVSEVRDDLNYVNVLNGFCYASDGHRFHKAPTKLADGVYDPRTMLRVDKPAYPASRLDTFNRYLDAANQATESARVSDLVECPVSLDRDNTLHNDDILANRDYVLAAVNGNKDLEVNYCPKGAKGAAAGALYGTSSFGVFVVMLMKMKKTKSIFIPVTPGDTPLPHLGAKSEKAAWEKLLKDAAPMPYDGVEGFKARGYTVEEWSDYRGDCEND